MELCCGVLLGMGENVAQRLELIDQLAELAPEEVPVNFLDPRPGTPLAIRTPVRPLEAIRWIALLRLGLPGVILRYAGGREMTLGAASSHGHDRGHQCPHSRQLPDNPRPEPGCRPGHASGLCACPSGCFLTSSESTVPGRHCSGCGRIPPACPTGGMCRGGYEPPRYCPECGRRLRVLIIPTGWTAECRDHGTTSM